MSTATRDVPLLSPEEYLTTEREAQEKSEYFGGKVVAFAGASPAHNAIVFNLVGVLYPQLRGRPCRGFPSDLRVHIPVTGSFTYPDVVVVCGEPVFHDQQRDTLLNPTLVVEILSESTEQRDRGIKAEHYHSRVPLRPTGQAACRALSPVWPAPVDAHGGIRFERRSRTSRDRVHTRPARHLRQS
jgi:Uma2 family endonuclease